MQDSTTSTHAVVAYSLWAATILTFATAATVLALGGGHWAVFVAEVACGLSAFAAVMHIRYYAVRGMELVRACSRNGSNGNDSGSVEGVPVQRLRR